MTRCSDGFEARRPDAEAFALANRVLLLKTRDGVEIDVALAAFPFEIEAIVAARTHDLSDMESIVRRQGARLDVERVRRWGREFAELKEDPDLLRPFEIVFRAVIGGR